MKEAQPGTGRPPLWQLLIVVGLLLTYFVLAVTATLQKCTTYDEIAHLTAGYSFWRHNDYRFQGNWPQRRAALPLLWSNPVLPKDLPSWHQANVWQTGKHFFYFAGNNADAMLLQGRIMMALVGVALGALIFFYSRKLFGTLAGFLSLALFVICPTMLANGPLITADVPAAFFFLASLPAIWWLLHEVTPASLLVSGCVLSGLFLTKYSAILIVPVAGLLLLLRLTDGRPLPVRLWKQHTIVGRRSLLAMFAAVAFVQILIIGAMIWLSFGCRYAALNNPVPGQDQLRPGWDQVVDFEFPQTAGEIILRARDAHLLPEAYLYWFAYTLRTSLKREAFLNGEWSDTGFRSFFPYSFAVKTPLGILAILVLAALTIKVLWNYRAWRETWNGFYATAPLWIFLAVYWTTSIFSHINIGHRHILPVYPVIYVLAGAAAAFWPRSLTTQETATFPVQVAIFCSLLLITALGWAAVELLRIWPHYLAYFNQLAGGPRQAYKHLVDSSLDWGQDLPGLKKWLERKNPDGKHLVYLDYFGTGYPDKQTFKVEFPPRRLPGQSIRCAEILGLLASPFGPFTATARLNGEYLDLPEQISDPLQPGIYCISATHLQGVYVPFRGSWNVRHEQMYQKNELFRWHYHHRAELGSRIWLDYLEQQDEPAHHKSENWRGTFVSTYADLCYARLRKYLREKRVPDDHINYSILIYVVTAQDLAEAFQPLVLPE